MSSAWHRDDEAEPISDVNVVPLADVSLVLLIILLVLSPMTVESRLHIRTAGKPPEAPASSEPQPPLPPERELVLMVDLGPAGIMVGEVFFTNRREFLAYMAMELSTRTDRKVFLAPHPDIPHGMVMEAIESLKACGAEAVALVQTAEPAGE
ncbi:MAG: biopolymer transporter ExbD [Elusimicrobia bacterium]|nr:biopolymer transporter ExbD [Elusimicrobiota bacterium]